MDLVVLIIAILIGAVLWRIRGGWLALPSTTLARAAFFVPYGGWAYWLTGDPWMGLMGLAIWAGMILPWAQWQDMGNVEENDDTVGMAGRGMLLTAVGSVVLAYTFGFQAAYIYLLGGIMMSPIYWAAWQFTKKVRLGTFIDGPTAVAELGVGAWVTFLLWLAITLGG